MKINIDTIYTVIDIPECKSVQDIQQATLPRQTHATG